MESATAEGILRTIGRAICTHGYADLTVEHIAAESSLTAAAIHYHFETKQALLNAFLDHSIDRYEANLGPDSADPRDRLEQFLDVTFTPPDGDDGEFAVALMQLNAQVPDRGSYRERFRRLDGRMRTEVRAAVREGIADGHFADADPETVARTVVTVADGGHVRGVALGEEPAESRAVVEAYLEQTPGWLPEGQA